jgi:ankyrin repeat protein
VELLIQNGADMDLQDDFNHTALYYARRGGNEDIIRLLLDCGATD